MLDHASSKDNHATFLRSQGTIVELSNILNEVNDEALLTPSIKIDDISKCTISEGRTVDRNIILPAPVINALLVIDLLTDACYNLGW